MKTVFNNQQCAHVWAAQTQPHGRSNSMHFDGRELYSYQTCIAMIHETLQGESVVLFNSHRYSATTSIKHMPAAHRATNNLTSYTVPICTPQSASEHTINLASFVASYNAEKIKIKRAVSEWGQRTEKLVELRDTARTYARCFGLEAPISEAQLASDLAEIRLHLEARRVKRETPAYLAAQARKAAKREEKRLADHEAWQARNAEIAAEIARKGAEQLANWHAGVAGSYCLPGDCLLRVRGDNVETSQGASVTVADARDFIPMIRACIGRGAFTPTNGQLVGLFRLREIRANGDVRIGCHFIHWSEIERIANELGV